MDFLFIGNSDPYSYKNYYQIFLYAYILIYIYQNNITYMDPEKTTEQITNNDNYSLSLITDGVCLQITLTIKVSKTRTDIYQIVLK